MTKLARLTKFNPTFSKGFIIGKNQEIEDTKQSFNLENITKSIERGGYEFENAYKINRENELFLDHAPKLEQYFLGRYFGILVKNLTVNLPKVMSNGTNYDEKKLDEIISIINSTEQITNLKIPDKLIEKYADKTLKNYDNEKVKKTINYLKNKL